jgi:hypothetical protein
MAQIFPRRANTIVWLSAAGLFVSIGMLFWLIWFLTLSNWARQVGPTFGPIPQPVPFSHALHVGNVKIDCRYCHSRIDQSSYANIPATETCMTCHSVIRTDSAKLAPVRQSWATGVPIQWNKVHDLPQFVYFNHQSHIAKGVGCTTCHGPIGTMGYNEDPSKGPVGGVYKVQPLYMSWCLGCHRHPEQYVRPKDQVFNPNYVPPANQAQLGAQLVDQYRIRGANQLTNCAICHR